MGGIHIIKLLLGGSPCTHWSIAQTKNRETEPSGLGWELFLNYKIARDKYKPDYFLYENNKSMSSAIRAQITKELGVEPVMTNSALVSAQSRQRLYWVGKRSPDGTYSQVDVEQPEDRGILLRDILESGACWREKAYAIDDNYYKTLGQQGFSTQSGRRKIVAEPAQVLNINPSGHGMNGAVVHINGKSRTLTTNKGEGPKIIEPVRIGTIESTAQNAGAIPVSVEWYDGKTYPVYEVRDGLITIKGKQYPIKLSDGYYIIRKLTVTECERLQTVPEGYTRWGAIEWAEDIAKKHKKAIEKGKARLNLTARQLLVRMSDTQAYKLLGNGWTVDVIAHILSHIPGIAEDPVEVLSMYDGMSCGHIALDKLGANVIRYYATENYKYAIQNTMANYPDTVQLGDAFQVRDDGWSI